MKCIRKIAGYLAAGVVAHASLQAADAVLPDNPYTAIPDRNVFGLNPIVVADTSNAPEPPVKITANGIMSIFGKLQVLFKTSGGGPAKPGQPAKDQSYVLSIGQRQDDIEVIKIDEKNGLVTFNNHGLMQDLTLTPIAATPAPAVMPGAVNPNPASAAPGLGFSNPANNDNSGNNGFGRFGNRGGRGVGGGGSGGDGSNFRNVPTRNGTYQPSQELPQMSPEAQTIAIEAQREKYKAQGNPAAALLPPTALTPGNGGGNDAPPAPGE